VIFVECGSNFQVAYDPEEGFSATFFFTTEEDFKKFMESLCERQFIWPD
jgi:hypothetical protein